ncbi:MAG: 3-oxoacyl-ACP reductase FabG [Desulfovibrionales bacterium]|nr:3-oxoacyl-ACP reductase FabG [Desulfovibrionales bacterium]
MSIAKIALVTGGSKGIGKAVALRLAHDGFDIWLNYKSDTHAAQAVQKGIVHAGQKCTLLPFDVSDGEACKQALAPLLEADTPFVLVNNAGFARDAIMAMMSPREWHDVLHIHLDGFYNVTSQVLPKMIRKRAGRIINIASTSGQTGVGGQVNYSAAKAGLIGATRSLAVEVAKRNILVNAVSPGFIETEMLSGLHMDKILPTIPQNRVGMPEEVAGAVSFLASNDATYICGQVIAVNGGIFTG